MRQLLVALAAGGALAISASTAAGQRRASWAADATAGVAFGQGGDYRFRSRPDLRLAVSRASWRSESSALFVEGALTASFVGTVTLDCEFTASGGCREEYPDVLSATAVLGTVLRPRRGLDWRLGLGPTVYRLAPMGTPSEATLGMTAQGDVAMLVAKPLALVAGARLQVIPSYQSQTLWLIPWMVGVRLR